jgi:hypothetical protein
MIFIKTEHIAGVAVSIIFLIILSITIFGDNEEISNTIPTNVISSVTTSECIETLTTKTDITTEKKNKIMSKNINEPTDKTTETTQIIDVAESSETEEYEDDFEETEDSNDSFSPDIEEYEDEYSECEPEEIEYDYETSSYQGVFTATYYEGSVGSYGYSGYDLTSGYSIASNVFPQGTLIQVVGGGLDGIYCVEDRGGMADNVIDFFYFYGDVPGDFYYKGVVDIEVYVIY